MNIGQKRNLSEVLAKPLTAAAFAAAMSSPVLGGGYSANLPNMMNMPLWAGVGLAAGLGTGLGTIGKDYVLPMLGANSSLAQSEGMLLTPLLSGLGTTAILYPSLGGQYAGYASAFALGAGSAVAGDYTYNTIISPYIK